MTESYRRGDLRAKLRGEISHVSADALLPHHRRGALVVAAADLDLLDAAVAIAEDDVDAVTDFIESGRLAKPSLGDLASWCVDEERRFQFVIVRPYVLAQRLPP